MHIQYINYIDLNDLFTFSIHPNLRKVIYCSAIANGDEYDWEFAWKEYQKATVPAEKDKLRYALSCTKEIWLLNRSGQRYKIYTISTTHFVYLILTMTFVIPQISSVYSWPFKDKKNGYGLYYKLHCQKCRRPASRLGFHPWALVLHHPRVSYDFNSYFNGN